MATKALTWEQKAKLVAELDSGGESVKAVCGRWRISSECADKWWRRYKADGLDGLREASRAPRRQPRRETRNAAGGTPTLPEARRRASHSKLGKVSWKKGSVLV